MHSDKWRAMNPALVLLLFRNGTASDWTSLCHAFDLSPKLLGTPSNILRHLVEQLIQAKLLTVDGSFDVRNRPNASIKISEGALDFFTALNLSLKEIATVYSHRSMFIEPSFGRPDSISPDKRLDLFILMPFSPNIKGVYEDHIKSIAENMKLKAARADDFFTANTVIMDIWTAICESRIILADCTGRNPNVFYEIGLAHTIGKPVILITQNSEDVPFDLAHYRHIKYEYTPRGMKQFESTLQFTLQSIIKELDETRFDLEPES